MLGAFALIAAGAVSQVRAAGLFMDVLALIGIVTCLAGWRVLVVARHREDSSPSALQPVWKTGPLASMDDDIVAAIAPAIQRYLDGDIHPAASQKSARSVAADRADHRS
jgi:hypothetical protein